MTTKQPEVQRCKSASTLLVANRCDANQALDPMPSASGRV